MTDYFVSHWRFFGCADSAGYHGATMIGVIGVIGVIWRALKVSPICPIGLIGLICPIKLSTLNSQLSTLN